MQREMLSFKIRITFSTVFTGNSINNTWNIYACLTDTKKENAIPQ